MTAPVAVNPAAGAAPGTPNGKRRLRRASLGALFGVVLLDLLGFGIVIPQLGIQAAKLDSPPWLVGLLLSSYSLMQLFFAPVLGRLSDRYGRRPVLLYSVAGSMVGFLLFGFATSLLWLFASRIIDGISGANIATAQAYVADVTSQEERAKGMGVLGAAFGIGFVLGPAVGGFLGALGGNFAIGMAAAGLAALNFVLIYFFLPESLKPSSAPAPRKSLAAVRELMAVKGVGEVLLACGVFVTAFAAMEGTFAMFFLVKHLGADPIVGGSVFHRTLDVPESLARTAAMSVGWLFVTIGVVSAIIQGGLIGRLRRWLGEPRLAIIGSAVTAVGLLAMALAPSYGWLFVPMAVLALGSALVNPSLSALASLRSPAHRQGEAMGAFQAMGSLGRVVGPALGGVLFAVFGPSAGLYGGAGLMVVAAALCLRLLDKRERIAASGKTG